jgi:hypothetical protein
LGLLGLRLLTHLHMKANMTKQLSRIQLALDCSLGTAIPSTHDFTHELNSFPDYRSHLPQLFIGMEHIQLSNMQLAESHLAASVALCDSDPILFNELGTVAYENRK